MRRGEPPDTLNWRDTGCAHAPHCLECPFERCLFEVHHTPGSWRVGAENDARILPLLAQGMKPDDVAAQLGVSRRTVFRAQERQRKGAS